MTHCKRTGNWIENAASKAAAERIAHRIEMARPELTCMVRDDMHWHTIFVSHPEHRNDLGSITVYPGKDPSAAVAKGHGIYLKFAVDF
jgi:hypothetical protein